MDIWLFHGATRRGGYFYPISTLFRVSNLKLLQEPIFFPHRKIVAIPLFKSLVAHFDKLVKSPVNGHGKSEQHHDRSNPKHIDVGLDDGL